MATKVHRGAIPTRLAGPDDQTCDSILQGMRFGDKLLKPLKCVYIAGHEGLHYCAGEIWGNTHDQQHNQ